MGLTLVTRPSTPAVTLDEAKAQLRVEDTASDALIEGLIEAATRAVEDGTGRALAPAQYDLSLDGFPYSLPPGFPAGSPYGYPFGYRPQVTPRLFLDVGITIPLAPLVSVDSVKYVDPDGTTQTIDPSLYRIVPGQPAHVVPAFGQSWPAADMAPGVVTVRFTAGYQDEAHVPSPLKQAILFLVAHWYDNRSAVLAVSGAATAGASEVPLTASYLMKPYRIFA